MAADPATAANDWWFNRKGFLMGGYIEDLTAYVQQVRAGDLASAVVSCSRMQGSQISSIPVPDPVFGKDVATMFHLGSGGLLLAADNCQEYFKKPDAKALDNSLQWAGDCGNALNGVRTEIFEKRIKLS